MRIADANQRLVRSPNALPIIVGVAMSKVTDKNLTVRLHRVVGGKSRIFL